LLSYADNNADLRAVDQSTLTALTSVADAWAEDAGWDYHYDEAPECDGRRAELVAAWHNANPPIALEPSHYQIEGAMPAELLREWKAEALVKWQAPRVEQRQQQLNDIINAKSA
jgi:hypothetical protein